MNNKQRQEVIRLIKLSETPSSNANKYRHQLYAYIDAMIESKPRLDYLRREIQAERISYGEVAELQSLIDHIDDDDIELLQWAKDEEE